jgi:hypothetical protein
MSSLERFLLDYVFRIHWEPEITTPVVLLSTQDFVTYARYDVASKDVFRQNQNKKTKQKKN